MVDRFYNLGEIFKNTNLVLQDISSTITDINLNITSGTTASNNSHIYGSNDNGTNFIPVLVDSAGKIITNTHLVDNNGDKLTTSKIGNINALDVNLASGGSISIGVTGIATETTLLLTNTKLDTLHTDLASTIHNDLTTINNKIIHDSTYTDSIKVSISNPLNFNTDARRKSSSR